MPVRVNEPGDGTIHVSKMKVGQIGVIIDKTPSSQWDGDPVIRGEDVIANIKDGYIVSIESMGNFRVRVLPNGTTLTVEDNE